MDQIDLAIREALFERLRKENISCRIGSALRDCSCYKYEDAIEVDVCNESILLVFDSRPNVGRHSIRAIWSNSPMKWVDLSKGPIAIDIAEPEFKSAFDYIVALVLALRLRRIVPHTE